MAGTAKFEVSSVSPEELGFSGNFANGRGGNYPGPNLDRSGSFREGSEGRAFSSGMRSSKVKTTPIGDISLLKQSLNLEQFPVGDQKYTCEDEVTRALIPFLGNNSEDNSFGNARSKPPSTMASMVKNEIKRHKASMFEGSMKARNRVKRIDESLNSLGKYFDSLTPKKQLTNERSGGSNLMKMGNQSHRSSPDLVTQKLEERDKSFVPNKRARTPMVDMRAEGRSNGLPRQHLVGGKDKNASRVGSIEIVEEKIRRLPAGGEGWDKKMKRKRSGSTVLHRQVDGDGEQKRPVHGRLASESVTESSDTHGFRSASSNGANGINKHDGGQTSANLSARVAPKHESDRTSLSRELPGMNKERLIQKGNIKSNMRDDTPLFGPSSVTKGKASRAHRAGLAALGNSSPSFSRMSVTAEDREQSLNVNKVHSLAGVNNRKRTQPAESSSPPMAQWVQRPQKISRNRRTNIVSPTSKHEEAYLLSEGCTSDFSTQTHSGVNGSLPVRKMTSSSQQQKMKFENAPSPARLSESEDNSVGENIQKGKSTGGSEGDERGTDGRHLANLSGSSTQKSKLVAKGEIVNGVRRQGRTGRGSSFSRGSMSSMREKLENPSAVKPGRSSRPSSEKNGSKTGRPPLKKHSDRKGFTRPGTVPNSNSPDYTGELDDDREELAQAALLACNCSYNGCSTSFWKEMEPLFSLGPTDVSFLEEQMREVEHQPEPSEMSVMGDDVCHSFVSGKSNTCMLDNGLAESCENGNLINQIHSNGELYAENGPARLAPLYQRVLSALIVEDAFEESEDNKCGSNAASSAMSDDPCSVVDRISCNGYGPHSRFSSIQDPLHEEMDDANYDHTLQSGQVGHEPFQSDVDGSLASLTDASGGSLLECRYDQISMDEKIVIELQSIGLSLEPVPYLAEGEDETINYDIVHLKEQLSQQAGKKKLYLDRIHKVIEETKETDRRELEQRAMSKLTELAYRKLLPTRGNSAARIGTSKVSRNMAFITRTLARCRKFEDSGKSCFTEPALRDVLYAVPSHNAGAVDCIGTAVQNARTSGSEQPDLVNEKSDRSPFEACRTLSPQSDHAFAKNGPLSNRGKKKEVLLDDVSGNASLRSTSSLGGSTFLGGAKGKRSERESGAKIGRPRLTNMKGERKVKSKPKQKAGQISSAHPVQPSTVSSELATIGSSRRREGQISPGNILDSSKENKDSMGTDSLPLHDLDPIEDLSAGKDFGGNQDLTSWLNFDDVDGLQDHDSLGLEIPMDDLSGLDMLM